MDVASVEEHRHPTTTTTVTEVMMSPQTRENHLRDPESSEGFPETEEIPEECTQGNHVKSIPDSPSSVSSLPSVVFTHTNEDAVKLKAEPVKTIRSSTSLSSNNEPVCRICHDTEDERGKTKLISPCGCSGSAQFTHKKCLQKWTNVKGATKCEICNQSYKPKYMRFKQKLLTRQVMCMGSAASLPLLVVIIVGFFLLGEQLTLGEYDSDTDSSTNGNYDDDETGTSSTSKLMVSVCMIATATFGIFLLCCFSIWAAKVQPQQLENASGGHVGQHDGDVESGRGGRGNNPRQQRVLTPLYFF